jgi:hypothetical protein
MQEDVTQVQVVGESNGEEEHISLQFQAPEIKTEAIVDEALTVDDENDLFDEFQEPVVQREENTNTSRSSSKVIVEPEGELEQDATLGGDDLFDDFQEPKTEAMV